jgi:hypothetical protein
MSAATVIPAELKGFTARVLRAVSAEGVGDGLAGIGTSAVVDPETGDLLLALTIRHLDGQMLTALMGEAEIDRLADMLLDYVKALTPLQSRARH